MTGSPPLPETEAPPSASTPEPVRVRLPRPLPLTPLATRRLITTVCLLLSAAVMAYPVVATYYNDMRQREFARQYDGPIAETPPDALDRALREARHYNATRRPTLLEDPWTTGPEKASAEYDGYESTLDDFDVMARLRIPGIDVQLPVYHGTSDETLTKGVGHFYGTDLPVGGAGTHAALTAHSSFSNATLFDNLEAVAPGDTFFVDVYGQTLAYQVDRIDVALPDAIDQVARIDSADHLTLITCTPRGVNSHRLLVRGVRVPYTAPPAGAPDRTAMPWRPQTWMWPRLAGTGIALGSLAALTGSWIVADRRRHSRERHQVKEAGGAPS